MVSRKKSATAPSTEPAPKTGHPTVKVRVAPGYVVACSETHLRVREGGVAVVPKHQYTLGMGELVEE